MIDETALKQIIDSYEYGQTNIDQSLSLKYNPDSQLSISELESFP
jgi:hypothetical protein